VILGPKSPPIASTEIDTDIKIIQICLELLFCLYRSLLVKHDVLNELHP
jgi:hypothetical protein